MQLPARRADADRFVVGRPFAAHSDWKGEDETMEDQRFDELAKTCAKPVSRRQMVKVLVATTVGGLFVRSGSSKAFAGTCNPNNICAHFCNATFGGDTAASAQCASDAAHCKGACYTCGPMRPDHTVQPTCCQKNSSGYCASYLSTPCCTSGQFCCGGQCITNCAPPDQCHQPGVCNPSTHTCVYANKTNGTACTGTHKCF